MTETVKHVDGSFKKSNTCIGLPNKILPFLITDYVMEID